MAERGEAPAQELEDMPGSIHPGFNLYRASQYLRRHPGDSRVPVLAFTRALGPINNCRVREDLWMSHFDDLAEAAFTPGGYPTDATVSVLRNELVFQRAVQAYLWSLPAVNIWAMKEGSEALFGAGYHVLPTWKDRINAATLVTTPNFDVVYAMAYLDLDRFGPLVVEAPAGVQGMFDDFWQRPIVGPTINGHTWKGDVGLAGPDAGKGGTFVLLPPGYTGPEPDQGYVYRSRTNNVFLFWRAFFQDPTDLSAPVARIEDTVIYPFGAKDQAQPMQFPNASGVPCNMLFPADGTYFDMLDRFIQAEAVDPADLDLRGFLHTIGINKGAAFDPSPADRALLDKAARTAFKLSKVTITSLLALEAGGTYYPGRPWVNTFAGENTEFQSSGSFTNLEQRTGFFTSAYSNSPGMVENIIDRGAKYPATMKDARRRVARRRQVLCVAPAARHTRRPVLVRRDLRQRHRLRTRQRPTIPVDQHHGPTTREP